MIYRDVEPGVRTSGLFQKYLLNANKITVHVTRADSAFSGRFMCTFKSMLDNKIKQGQQWAEFVYPILLPSNHKSVDAATGLTPQEARKQ